MLSSVLVGLSAGIAAVTLKTTVYYIHLLFINEDDFKYRYILMFFFPLIGITATVIYIKYFLKGKFGKGSAYILQAIAKKSSIVEKVTLYSHMITSAITVGFGGSAGLEAPIVVTGAAFGSNYGRVNLLNYKDRTLMLACGSAAGIAAVFNSPIAGVMFAIEVLLTDISINAFIPLLLASASGALCSKIILKESILLTFRLRQPFDYTNIPYYIILGILTGFVSLYYARVFIYIDRLFKKFKSKVLLKALTGGLLLGILVFFFPPLFGEGYNSIKVLAGGETSLFLKNSIFSFWADNQWVVISFIGVIALIKVIATSLTLNSGGNGGNFAPSLFVGAYLGFFFARLVNMLKLKVLPESNFSIVAMAGIMAGVMYAPLTGIFLIAEITGGYELMIPLMIVSASAYAIVKHFEPYSMDTRELAKLGHLLTRNRDRTILTLLDIQQIIETNFSPVPSYANFHELTKIIAHSKRNVFPIVDEEKKLLGIITLENIREILFELEEYKDVLAVELMDQPPALIQITEDMSSVMKKFDDTGAWNLPVVEDGKYVGFVSKSSIFNNYRNQLINNFTEE
jgi:CIC family chloride channel protein